MEDEKKRIIEYAQTKFFNDGFYKTSMDELASGLRISKKTIYKFFPSKTDLVRGVAHMFRDKLVANLMKAFGQQQNAVLKIAGLMEVFGNVAAVGMEKWFKELQNHMPEEWEEIDRFRVKMMTENLTKIFEQGKKEDLFIDRPTELMIAIAIAAVRSTVNPYFILNNNISVKNSMFTTIEILMNGFCTDKGKEIFYKSFDRIKNEK